MIKYYSGAYGTQVLFRLHGSAAFKAITPAAISTAFYIILFFTTTLQEEKIFGHPYPIGALMVAFTFLLTFKASFSYNRYWEATTAVHQMHSKWLDVGMELCAFHLQSDMYQHKPPAFGQHPNVDQIVKRKRINEPTLERIEQELENMELSSKSERGATNNNNSLRSQVNKIVGGTQTATMIEDNDDNSTLARPLVVDPKLRKPSLFLQEAAHLISLLSAVAMSTLRNDVEGCESPLVPYETGLPWPHVDPDSYSADIRKGFSHSRFSWFSLGTYLLGLAKSPEDRTLYNAARPFRVIGGVSDNEIRMLQEARGPFAKVALCTVWLQEFISREYLNGSTGKVGPPIISRLYQFTSDGMLGYNQARKVAQIPFPFPHAQLTAMFIVVVGAFIPILMLSFLSDVYFGAVLNLLTVMCFTGLHEVSRELEEPFTSVPNDIPLNYFQAQFNEGLRNMFVGYHPDAYWKIAQGQQTTNNEIS